MPNFSLFVLAPEEYGLETFSADGDIWTETDDTKTTASRYTSEASPRDSVMKFLGESWTLGDSITLGSGYYLGDSDDGKGEGVYKDYTVTPGQLVAFSCMYKVVTAGTLTILAYDQTNGATISTVDKTDATWTDYDLKITAPAGCTTIRIKFLQKSTIRRPGPFLIDNMALNESAIDADPDTYRRIPVRVGSFHQTLGGRRVYDLRAIHYTLELGWNYFDKDTFDGLKDLYYSGEKLYFDDGEVPQIIETETVYETVTENFVGITNPSSTNIAYTDSSASLPSAVDDFDTTEYSDAQYLAIDVDDTNYHETTDPTDTYYLYHRFDLESDVAAASVQRLRIKVACLSDDSSPSNLDGCILYIWNATDTSWVEIARSSSSAKTDLTFSRADANVAQNFVDSADDYIRLLLRSRGPRDGANSLSLRTYFVEAEVNENLDLIIELSHKAILDDDSDVVSVKNLTQGTTLALTTNYTISSDRTEITVSGQSSADEIEVAYNRYFEVMFGNLPEEWLSGDPSGDRERRADVILETVSETKY